MNDSFVDLLQVYYINSNALQEIMGRLLIFTFISQNVSQLKGCEKERSDAIILLPNKCPSYSCGSYNNQRIWSF